MIDSRFAVWVLGLIALAALPTTLHSYLELRADDGLRTSAISTKLEGLESRPTDRPGDWILNRYDSEDWIERMYRAPDGEDVQVFVARSYDHKLIYHHPEAAIAAHSRTGDYATEFRSPETVRLTVPGVMPVHVIRGRSGIGLAIFALHHGSEFVSNPYLFQIRSAAGLLFSPRTPMTLFFVHDRTENADLPIEDALVTELLLGSIESFLAQK